MTIHYEFDLVRISFYYNDRYYLKSWFDLVLVKENTENSDINIKHYIHEEYEEFYKNDFLWKIFEQRSQEVE